jgi:hypothetical protein
MLIYLGCYSWWECFVVGIALYGVCSGRGSHHKSTTSYLILFVPFLLVSCIIDNKDIFVQGIGESV